MDKEDSNILKEIQSIHSNAHKFCELLQVIQVIDIFYSNVLILLLITEQNIWVPLRNSYFQRSFAIHRDEAVAKFIFTVFVEVR